MNTTSPATPSQNFLGSRIRPEPFRIVCARIAGTFFQKTPTIQSAKTPTMPKNATVPICSISTETSRDSEM